METMFKLLFTLAFLVYSMISVGVFLLIVKIILMFSPQVHFLGLIIY